MLENKLLHKKEIDKIILRLSHEIIENNKDLNKVAVVGIRTRGDHIANRIIQNIIVVAQNKQDRITKFELMSRQDNVQVDLSEEIMKEYEKEIELNSYKILEDNFEPVENYLNPLTGKQYVKRIILEDGIASEISNDSQDWNPELTVNQLLFVSIAAVVLVYSIYSYSNTEKN